MGLATSDYQPPLVQLALGQTSSSSVRQKTQLGLVSHTSSSERKIYLNRFVAQCHGSSGSRPTLVQIIPSLVPSPTSVKVATARERLVQPAGPS